MDKIFTALRYWLTALVTTDRAPDQFSAMSLADLADLPITHLRRDD